MAPPGISAGFSWLIQKQNVMGLLVNFWLGKLSASHGGHCSFFHTSLTFNIYDVGSKFTIAVTVVTFKSHKMHGGTCHFNRLLVTGKLSDHYCKKNIIAQKCCACTLNSL